MERKLWKEIPNYQESITYFGNLYPLLAVAEVERGDLLGTDEKSPVRGDPNRAGGRNEGKEGNLIPFDIEQQLSCHIQTDFVIVHNIIQLFHVSSIENKTRK